MWLVEFLWRGYGYIVPFIVVIVQVITGAIGSAMSNDMYGRDVGHTPVVIGWLVSALLLWFIGRRLNRKVSAAEHDLPDGVLPTKNSDLEQTWQHSLFWIPFEYWSVVCLGFAVWRYLS